MFHGLPRRRRLDQWRADRHADVDVVGRVAFSRTDLINNNDADVDAIAAAILARNPPKRPEVKFLIKNSPCYVGLNKDEPMLLAKVNEIIAAAKSDGTLNAIAQKWLGTDLPADL